MKLLEFLETIRENDTSSGPGKFVGARLTRDSERAIMQWMRDNGLRKKEPRARLHITVVGDKEKDFDWNPATFDPPLEIDPHTYELKKFGDKAIVLAFSVPELEKRHEKAVKKYGIHWNYDTYQPHLTLAFDPSGLNNMKRLLKPTFPMYVANEYAQPWEFNEEDSSTERRRKSRMDEEFLMERNLMNAPWAKEVAEKYALDNFVSGFTEFPYIGEWAKRALTKYLINEYPGVMRVNSFEPWRNQETTREVMRDLYPGSQEVRDGQVVGQGNVTYPAVSMYGLGANRTRDMRLTIPSWAVGALERDNELYILDQRGVQGTGGLPEQTSLVRDWFRNRINNRDPIFLNPGRLNRMSWAQALQSAQQWHEEMRVGNSNDAEREEDKELFLDLGDQGKWWKLTGETCLNREGELMGHCVADYIDEVENGNSIILSLRDKKNHPHVTIELQPYDGGMTIEQIKGKENEPPVKKYWPQVEAVLKHLKSKTVISAGDEMGEQDLASLGLIIVPIESNPIIRVKANGDAGEPLDWSIQIQGTITDMGEEMEHEEDSTVQEFADDHSIDPAELIYHLAKDGEYRVEGYSYDYVVYPMYAWSMQEI